MKIIIDYKEGLDIIKQYYKKKGFDVKKTTLSLQRTGRVRNIKFEIEVDDKI